MHLWWRGRRPNFQALLLFACAIAGALFPSGVEGTEFSGGRVTGPLLAGVNFSILLFLCAAALTFVRPRLGAVVGCLAAAVAVPFYGFFVATGAFEYLFSGDFKTMYSTGLVWDPAALAIIALILVTTIVSLRRAPAGVV